MAVFELARFTVDPANIEKLLAGRDQMIAAIRETFPGLIAASLARLDERAWIDVWQWESLEAAKAGAEGAPSVPEAAAMFGLIDEVLAMEHAEILHQG